ncbi:MAG: polymerase, sigma-24 subunit, subfamily [Bryobacterales bacterium]|jgi:RNA polymerase sigma-70 factor (ECF subfamily)|nr:polymerase, sigma-24 subunit, subfamily [Bryobacterales bacterium]
MTDRERTRLISLAYGYLGSLADSEDIVQEALLRFQASDRTAIANPEAWLTTVVTRLAIDKLRSAQHRREVYPGEWLPEPVFGSPSPEQDAITRSRLSLGLLYLLEKLKPEQRIVFVLREVFEYSWQEIAAIAGKSEAACRQLMVRARAALSRSQSDRGTDAPLVQNAVAEGIITRFIAAVQQGDQKELLGILALDAVLIGDGGGKVPSVLNPIYGADRIARFLMGINGKHALITHPALVNSAPGTLTWLDGHLHGVTAVEVRDGLIRALYYVSNPDKLTPRRT